jgi:hypothetical protein
MNELHEDEEDMRCQIILRHRDGVKLRDLYEKIIESSDVDADSFVSSEAAKDFMARLRIGIMADQAPVPDPKDGPPADIVFLQDVIARHAGLEWYLEACNPMTSATLIPARWSRRRPEVASAVMSHPFTRVVFRVGDDDAKKLAEGFSYFEAKDLRNLDIGQAVCRVERSDYDFNLAIPLPVEPGKDEAVTRRQEVITVSRNKYGTARADVEAMQAKSRATRTGEPPAASPPAKPVVELPKLSEVPKAAETPAIVEITPPVAAEIQKEQPPVIKHEPPRDLGRGGAQHQAIQHRIKQAAEALGFRSVIEKPVLDGQGSVDLWLERTGQTIACEISISTTIDHEVRNVVKCLKAGVPKVAIICLDEERLRKIGSAVSGSLGAELAAQVEYFQPDQFVTYLKTIPAEIPKEQTTVRRGYKIKRVISEISTEQQKEKEAAAIRAIADSMQK